MARKEADLSVFHIAQHLNSDYWFWTDEEKETIGTPKMFEVIKDRLKELDFIGCYGIYHDKDTKEQGVGVLDCEDSHIHIIAKLKDDSKATLTKIARLVGISSEYIEKAKNKYSYDNWLAYLTHIKEADKYFYNVDEVVTLYGEDYQKIYKANEQNWLDGRIFKEKKDTKRLLVLLLEKIHKGKILSKNEILLNDECYRVYKSHKREIDEAFEIYSQRKMALAEESIKNGDFKITVYFITGASGSGKSYFTDRLVETIQEKTAQRSKRWGVYQACATNPFDDYLGEEILIMDDLRGMALTPSDWLRLLDNERINFGSARYKNKKISSRFIIINSEKEMPNFFAYMKNIGGGNISENIDQFFRRILTYIKVIRLDSSDFPIYEVGNVQRCEPYKPLEEKQFLLTYNHKKDTKTYTDIDECLDFLTNQALERANC